MHIVIVQVIASLKQARPSKMSVIESMMETLEEYVGHLEDKVQERTRELADVNKSLEHLLHQILPPTVATSLSQGRHSNNTFDVRTHTVAELLWAKNKHNEAIFLTKGFEDASDKYLFNQPVYNCIHVSPNQNLDLSLTRAFIQFQCDVSAIDCVLNGIHFDRLGSIPPYAILIITTRSPP